MRPARQDRSMWPLAALVAALAVLTLPLAIGSSSARLGALGAMAGVFVGFAASMLRTRHEHADDVDRPGLLSLARETAASTYRIYLFLSLYVLVIVLVGRQPESAALGIGAATAASVLVAVSLFDAARRVDRREGVERDVFLRSTSNAFFTTAIGSLTYGLFEVFTDAPKLSMLVVWSVAMGTWAIQSLVLGRRSR